MPTTKYLLRVSASNLTSRGLHVGGSPDTYAVVSYIRSSVQSSSPTSFRDCINDKNTKDDSFIGKTEVINKCRHPSWSKTLYIVAQDSNVHFSVRVYQCKYINQENPYCYGEGLYDVADIMSTPQRTRCKRLPSGGCVSCQLEPIHDENYLNMTARLQFAARDLVYDRKQSQSIILEIDRTDPTIPDRRTHIYRSHSVKTIQHSTGTHWKTIKLGLSALCGDNVKCRLRFSVYSVDFKGIKHLIGYTESSLCELVSMVETSSNSKSGDLLLDDESSRSMRSINTCTPELCLKDGSSPKHGDHGWLRLLQAEVIEGTNDCAVDISSSSFSVGECDCSVTDSVDLSAMSLSPSVVERSLVQRQQRIVSPPVHELQHAANYLSSPVQQHENNEKHLFQYYVRQGACQIDFCVAIDFTSSNGDPRLVESNHYLGSDSLNVYEETIKSIGKVLAKYSTSQEYSVWGFGAKYGGAVRHIFQCGSEPVIGVDGILSAYRAVFSTDLVMSKPIRFDAVIQKAAALAKKSHDTMFHGSLRYTVLLIITNGIMNNFEEISRKLEFFSDMPLSIVFVGVGRSTDFRPMYELCHPQQSGQLRRNTTFVEFRQHQSNPKSLAEAALRNIPSQLCHYMLSRGF